MSLSFAVHWRVPVGCDWSGFFTEVALGFIPALHAAGVHARLLSGKCEDAWVRSQLEPKDADVLRAAWMDEATLSAEATSKSLAIEHGDPCAMRRWPARHPRGARLACCR